MRLPRRIMMHGRFTGHRSVSFSHPCDYRDDSDPVPDAKEFLMEEEMEEVEEEEKK